MDNVVFTSGRDAACNKCTDRAVEKKGLPIQIPQYRVLDSSYYDYVGEEEDGDDEVEGREETYGEWHRPYEVSEACGRFLNCGQGLSDVFKDGLKIKLRLPKNSGELPSIIH